MAPIRLRHIHLPASPSDGIYPSYKTAAALQELLRRRLLDFKDAESSPTNPRTLPLPTLISFTPQPTYTLGRRQNQSTHSSSLGSNEIARLKAPLRIHSSEPEPLPALGTVPQEDDGNASEPQQHQTPLTFHPTVLTSPRGGLATYHGPGQVVLWPVMAINASQPLGYKHFTVRCYSRLLEATTIALLRRLFGLAGFTTEDPGVWVRSPTKLGAEEVRKISALGIHLRRHVSGLGAAVNLDMPTTRGGVQEAEKGNPWARFTACGLEGKGVTCVEEELRLAGGRGIPGLDGEVVARAWAAELAERMDLDPASVELVERDEVEEMKAMAERDGYLDLVGKEEL